MLAEQLPVTGAGELGSAIGVDDKVLRVVALNATMVIGQMGFSLARLKYAFSQKPDFL